MKEKSAKNMTLLEYAQTHTFKEFHQFMSYHKGWNELTSKIAFEYFNKVDENERT